MSDIERGPGREAPPEGELRPEEEAAPAAERAEAKAEHAERNARAEVSSQRRESRERIADVLWERPKQFVERVIQKNIAPYLRRFLGKFSELDDEAMASDALRKTRDAAAHEAGKEEKD
ncbi:MAG TPA: hypothetical protein VL426_05020 [Candidatus Binatia bacterium]|jgi:hypothetical protein|nr:hypothetical protein [Candidatus Binatia bacterium]